MAKPPRKPDRSHDRIFRFVFSRVMHARAALRALVGAALAEQLDWSSLAIEPGSYVEEAMRDSMSDLLFSIRFRHGEQRALAYLLWEHQRQPERLMPLRMVNYGGQALRDFMRRDETPEAYLPRLIPIVIAQGGHWPGPLALSHLHMPAPGPPGLPIFMDLEMIVHELREDSLPPGELTTLARTTLRLLRLAALDQLVGIHAECFARWLAQVHRAHGYDDYRALLEYILRTSTEDGLVEMIIAYTDEELLESANSIADKLEARGRVKGRAEGSAALLLRLLEHRFGPLPHQLEVRVLSADEARIEAWAMRVLDAATLDDVFAEP